MLISSIPSYYYLQPNCKCFLNFCDFLALTISHALSLPYIFFFSLSLSLFLSLSLSLSLSLLPLFLSLSQISLSFFNLLNALGKNLSLFLVACTHLLFSCLSEHPFVNCFLTFLAPKKLFNFFFHSFPHKQKMKIMKKMKKLIER